LEAVLGREGSSHGVFVPLISGYFLWINWKTISAVKIKYNYSGIPFILVGIIFPLLNIDIFQLECLSYLVFISGIIIFFLGKTLFKKISFPLLFCITMIPLPEDFYISMANLTRDITFNGSLRIIPLLGITFFKEGYFIHLPNTVLEVALGCSGIRYLISYFVFGLAYAYLFRKSAWSQVGLVVCTIPISLIASVLRLTFIFLLTYYISPKMAEHWPHVFISWSVFFVVLLLAIGLDQFFLNRISSRQD
jgi:exosortase